MNTASGMASLPLPRRGDKASNQAGDDTMSETYPNQRRTNNVYADDNVYLTTLLSELTKISDKIHDARLSDDIGDVYDATIRLDQLRVRIGKDLLKLQYLTANEEEIERALQLVRDVNEASPTKRMTDKLAEQIEKSKRGTE